MTNVVCTASRKEREAIAHSTRSIESCRIVIRDMADRIGELKGEQQSWWDAIIANYALDPNRSYQVNATTGEITMKEETEETA